MTVRDLPYSVPVRLHQIGAGLQRTLIPDAEARGHIARALDLAALDSLEGEVSLQPTTGGWTLSGRLRASLSQTCGVTLEPLPVEIDSTFAVLLAEASDAAGDEEVVVSLEDDSPDLIEGGQIDLGQYLVEQLALQLDPFPRKPGVDFVQPPEPAEISPFAVLRKLRSDDEG